MTDEQVFVQVYQRVLNFFGGNREKATAWFELPNPLLGNISPNDMVKIGRTYKLKQFVDSLLEDM